MRLNMFSYDTERDYNRAILQLRFQLKNILTWRKTTLFITGMNHQMTSQREKA